MIKLGYRSQKKASKILTQLQVMLTHSIAGIDTVNSC